MSGQDGLRGELIEALRTSSNEWARDRRVRRAVPMVERQADAVLDAVEKHIAAQRAQDHAEIEAQISEHVATRSQLAVVAMAEQRDAAVARAEAAEQAVQRVRELLVEDAWHYDDEIARALDGTP